MTTPFFSPSIASRDARRLSRRVERTASFIAFLCLSFLFVDAGMKLLRFNAAVEGTVRLGYSEGVVVPIGVVLLIVTILTAIPRTRVFGAILLTGYLGGATATHVRVGQAFYFPIVVGALVWLSIWLRDEKLRAIVWRAK